MAEFKVVVAGCGGMSHSWIEYALTRKDAEIVALVDLYEETAKKTAEKYELDCHTYTDIKTAIKETGANLVFDVTVPGSHKEITVTALSLGCNVFGEKPMGESTVDATEMLKAAKESGKSYSVMQNRRYNKQIRAFRDLIQSGQIGAQGLISADFFLGPHFGGFREEMASPLILDMAIHTFDQARFISNANPVSVYCHEFNQAGSWYKGNASAICIFEMDNGAVFNYRGSWSAEGAPTSWESAWRVTGSKGTAIWDGTNAPYAEIVKHTAETPFLNDFQKIEADLTWDGKDGHFGCLDEMFAALIEGRKAETDCTDNTHSVSMVYKAIESAQTGKKVFF
ncbi:Gfo/Idh/MocA family protein [Lederbergia citrea]|uniref:Gfo/Idh/MocA family oxidoreductase n=1 Tax=Lederbergia citrea TaxID=2833581 RepID=A0A942Z2X9_9BACI|nr:Gfo/Idh/MocA family oxidoreductase [Lederbergia citrea]MBS4205135.1 Gfo/Idh/MocA family oxidoreductase [Lederbergia citrea]MBS4223003.1 Gfo/Idh/MocA family oxidoreductase [Lederbergia citrea]